MIVFEIPFEKDILGISRFSTQPQKMFHLNETSTGKQLNVMGYDDQILLVSNTGTELKAFV